ncbi:ciliogenesis associated TTC17 interacting protein [Columba livia]|uniref:Ciliogenesis-associated TTC17-interacting protein n=1 Tax=Columba livia TaxID=8932 RepID=A0A2I0LH48_COLLI|nr:ciliogenesis-associated TTC17-interacting protein isoform X2 [Columba livia]PKK16653.1 ciliogenesis associated TTC17 interacting protein [Columba livia]
MEPPAGCQQETPVLTAAAAEFLSLIGLEELECCLFAETLQVVAAGDQAGGQWWAAVRWAPYERAGEPAQSCFLVQAGSRGRQDGVPCSSTLKAYVTPHLETLEQEEQEHLQLRAHAVERRTHIVSHQHGMTVTKMLQEQEGEPKCQSFSYSCDEVRGLLLEGASILLLRVLACRQAVPPRPTLTFPAIDAEGHLCTSSYRALGIQQQAVGSTEVKVFVIERAVHTSLGISTIWQSSFLPSGHLARRVQVGCPRLLLLQDESVLGEIGGVQPQLTFPKQPLDWEEDIQLCSWFLDQKEQLEASHTTYVRQHPELLALLADFLQALLLQQPPDPISFAAQFFAPFACQFPAGTPFASARAASPQLRHPPANGE